MKDNYVILDEIAYDNGAYKTIINTAIGKFVGYTEPDETDSQYPSIYHASEIALAKALRRFAKAVIKQLNREINLLEKMIKQACDSALSDFGDCELDLDNTAFRIMNGTLKQKKKEIKKWQARVGGLTKTITDRIAARDKIVAGYIERDKNK